MPGRSRQVGTEYTQEGEARSANCPKTGKPYINPEMDIMLRHGFVRKVFAIIFVQLAITAAMSYGAMQSCPGIAEQLAVVRCAGDPDHSTPAANPDGPGGAPSKKSSTLPAACQDLATKACKALKKDATCLDAGASTISVCEDNKNGFGMAMLNYGFSMYFFSFAILIVMICPCCCGDITHKHPHNLILLGGFTVSFSGLIAMICMTTMPELVATAALYTMLVVGGLTAFACQTKKDFTGMGTYIYGALWAMICFMFVSWFFPMKVGGFTYMIYNGLFGLVFAFFLIYDIQLVIGGSDKKAQYTLDDHVIAALNIYLDIVNLFIVILNLLQGGQR